MGVPSYGRIDITTGVGSRGETISSSIAEVDFIIERLRGVKRRVRSLEEVWPRVTDIIMDDIDETFETAGRGKWSKLSKRTIETRKARGTWPGPFPSQPILRETGGMHESIEVTRSTDTQLSISATDPKSKTHEYGSITDKIPARPFMYISNEGMNRIAAYIANYLEELIRTMSSSKNLARNLRRYGLYVGKERIK